MFLKPIGNLKELIQSCHSKSLVDLTLFLRIEDLKSQISEGLIQPQPLRKGLRFTRALNKTMSLIINIKVLHRLIQIYKI
jgi:hypothetical protein